MYLKDFVYYRHVLMGREPWKDTGFGVRRLGLCVLHTSLRKMSHGMRLMSESSFRLWIRVTSGPLDTV